MQCIERIEKKGHQPDGRESGGDFPGHDAALAHPRDHQLGVAVCTTFKQAQGSFHLLAAEPFRRRGDCGRFFLQAAGECGHPYRPQLAAFSSTPTSSLIWFWQADECSADLPWQV